MDFEYPFSEKHASLPLHEERQRLANLIDRVLAGDLDAETAVGITHKWDDTPNDDTLIKTAWHTLVHFQIDADIRQKDPRYDEGLTQQLRRLSEKLKSAP